MGSMAVRVKSLLGLLTAVSCFAYGCGPAGNGTSHESSDTDPVIIHRGNGGDAQTLDPALAQDTHTFNVLTDLYEGLLATDATGNIVNAAASSWEVSEDGRVYTFHLADDAYWSNGSPVTAGHFVTGMQRALSPATGSEYSFLLHPIRNAEEVASGDRPVGSLGVRVIDDRTLVIELGTRAPYFPSVLTMPIAYPHFGEFDVPHERFTDPDAFVGNGPFLLDEWHPGSHIRLRRNPTFREADQVAIDGVQFHAITAPVTELTMFQAEELDITSTVPGSCRWQSIGISSSRSSAGESSPPTGLCRMASTITNRRVSTGRGCRQWNGRHRRAGFIKRLVTPRSSHSS
jgi:ABC-type oligopeptide transport system substrate-binding subunit